MRTDLTESHGSWYLRCYVNGVRKRINLGRVERYSKRQAADRAREKLIELRQTDPSGKLTLSEYIRLIYLPVVKSRVRRSTLDGYAQIYRTHVAPRPEAALLLYEYSTHEVQRLLNAIADATSLTTTTLKHVKAFLSGVFRMATIAKERSGANPVHEAVLPSYSARQPNDTTAYDLATIEAVLQRLDSGAVKAALAIAFYAGLRRSEIQGLRWEDYDGQTLTIRRSVFNGHESAPKSKASRSTVPVIPALREILDQYRAVSETPNLFPTKLENLTRRPLRHAFEAASSSWIGFHAARRGLASNLFALGVEPGVVQKILRHSSLAVTMTHYVKVGDAQKEDAMEKFSRSLTKGRGRDAKPSEA